MLELRDLRHAYDGTDVLRVPRFDAAQGEHWLVLGPSGSGKSTLLHIVAGLLRPTSGEVISAGTRLQALKPAQLDRFRGQHVGIVLQQLHLVPTLTVEKNVMLAQYLAGVTQDRKRVAEVLESVGLGDKASAYPYQLSHGQAQRVAVARAVVNRPGLILADEPTSNLDDTRCMQALDLLESQARTCDATLVIATHDQRIRDRVAKQFTLAAAT
jgi:putative ABC transport system ATP-binding protein